MKKIFFLILIPFLLQAQTSKLLLAFVDGTSYSANSTALFGRMVTQPDATRKALIDNTFTRLSNNSLLTKLNALWFTAAHDSQSALLNWIKNDHNLVAQKSITFTVDRGFTGKSTDSSYLDTDFNPSVDSNGVYSHIGASIGSYVNTNIIEDHTFLLGRSGGGSASLEASGNIVRTKSWQGKINEGTAGYNEFNHAGRYMGLIATQRVDSTNTDLYFNGINQLTTVATSSNAGSYLLNGEFDMLRNGHSAPSNFSSNRVACSWIGGKLTDTEHDSLYNIINDYLVAVGGNESYGRDTLIVQDFEGTGFDNYGQWTVAAGTDNEDYTTIALRGSQSYLLNDQSESILNFPTHGDTTWVFFRIQISDVTTTGTKQLFQFRPNNATTNLGSLNMLSNGKFQIAMTATAGNVTQLSDATTYYVWLQHIVGNGSNGVINLWVDTDRTKPTTAEASITTGAATVRCGKLHFFNYFGGGVTMVIDQLIVSESAIGDVAE